MNRLRNDKQAIEEIDNRLDKLNTYIEQVMEQKSDYCFN